MHQIRSMITIACMLFLAIGANPLCAQRWMEDINRSVVAIQLPGDSIYLGWRMLGTDPHEISFNIYRVTGLGEALKLNDHRITRTTDYIDTSAPVGATLKYFVKPAGLISSEEIPDTTLVWASNYLSIHLQTPENYSPGDASVGDLDGDGDYELVVHMTGRGADNSRTGLTAEPILDAYEMDGTLLWRINLGINIREGAHYTQFMVYDLDGDGKAEIACKTADGSKDGTGKVIGDPDIVHRNAARTTMKSIRRGEEVDRDMSGLILRGPEYLSVFDGETGAELATVDYIPSRHPDTHSPSSTQIRETWGDD